MKLNIIIEKSLVPTGSPILMNGKYIGKVISVHFYKTKFLLNTAIDNPNKIPNNSKFTVVDVDAFGKKAIYVEAAENTVVYYANNDTVFATYKPIKVLNTLNNLINDSSVKKQLQVFLDTVKASIQRSNDTIIETNNK